MKDNISSPDFTAVHPRFDEAYANLWILIDEIDPLLARWQELEKLYSSLIALDRYIGHFAFTHHQNIADMHHFCASWKTIHDTVSDTILPHIIAETPLSPAEKTQLRAFNFGRMVSAVFTPEKKYAPRIRESMEVKMASIFGILSKLGYNPK